MNKREQQSAQTTFLENDHSIRTDATSK